MALSHTTSSLASMPFHSRLWTTCATNFLLAFEPHPCIAKARLDYSQHIVVEIRGSVQWDRGSSRDPASQGSIAVTRCEVLTDWDKILGQHFSLDSCVLGLTIVRGRSGRARLKLNIVVFTRPLSDNRTWSVSPVG